MLDGDLDAVVAELKVCIYLDPAAASSPPTVWANIAQHHDSRKRGGRPDGSAGGTYRGGVVLLW